MRHILNAGFLSAVLSCSLNAATLTSAEIDAVFDGIERNQPGCSVGVIQNGQLTHHAGYGMANMELEVPLDGSHVHRIASVSKQFTAMSVLLLADEGKIDLSDDIRKHLPELRDYGVPVTINAMLGHFAGMGDYDFIKTPPKSGMLLKSTMGGTFRLGNEDYLTIQEFYDYVKTVPLRHAPGEKFAYSNYAYFLLSMLVEEVSGESLRDYANRRIFQPLEMRDTFFSDMPTEIVKNRASGYVEVGDGEYETSMTNLFWVGDGGLHTNIADMARWDAFFYAPSLGKQPAALLARFMTPNSEFAAFGGQYANGQVIENIDGLQVISHGGSWLGTSTFYQRIPEKRFSSIVFCNEERVPAHRYAAELRQRFLD